MTLLLTLGTGTRQSGCAHQRPYRAHLDKELRRRPLEALEMLRAVIPTSRQHQGVCALLDGARLERPGWRASTSTQ